MDGFKNFLNESLQRKLSVTLSLAILGVALVAGIFSFLSAFNEAYELQDDVLRQVAALMDRQHLAPDVIAGRGSREGNEESRVISSSRNSRSSAAAPPSGWRTTRASSAFARS